MAIYAERVKAARNWNDCRIRDLIECMKSSKSNLEDFETLGRKASNKIDKCIAELERLRIAYKMEE